MAKQRRHQSSKPRRKPVQAPKPKVYTARTEAELYAKVRPTLNAKNRASLKERLKRLAGHKVGEGHTATLKHSNDGTTEKNFSYNGETYKSVTITPEGRTKTSLLWDVATQSATGTVDICGTPDVPFSVQAFEAGDPADWPFADCYCGDGVLVCLDGGRAIVEEPGGLKETWNISKFQVEDSDGVLQPTSGPAWGASGPNPDPPPLGTAGYVNGAVFCEGGGWSLWIQQVDAAGNVAPYYFGPLASIQEDCAVLTVDFGNLLVTI